MTAPASPPQTAQGGATQSGLEEVNIEQDELTNGIPLTVGSRYKIIVNAIKWVLEVKVHDSSPLAWNEAIYLCSRDGSYAEPRKIVGDGEPSEQGEDWVKLTWKRVPKDKSLRFVIKKAG